MILQTLRKKNRGGTGKTLFLCNPHNPVGRVWTKEELETIGDICYRHHVIVVSDEIHADFAFQGKHQVFANLKKEYEEMTIACTSPSKTFNLAGLQTSNIFIPNQKLKNAFKNSWMRPDTVSSMRPDLWHVRRLTGMGKSGIRP